MHYEGVSLLFANNVFSFSTQIKLMLRRLWPFWPMTLEGLGTRKKKGISTVELLSCPRESLG